MYFIVTVWVILPSGPAIMHEMNTMQFQDNFECQTFIFENKMDLLWPHIDTYNEDLKGFEFYCENRWND